MLFLDLFIVALSMGDTLVIWHIVFRFVHNSIIHGVQFSKQTTMASKILKSKCIKYSKDFLNSKRKIVNVPNAQIIYI